jgi:DNA-directed RNA polymerase subunit beta'
LDNLVVDHDCGTTGGVSLNVHDRSIEGRHLATDFKHGKLHVPAGTLLSPDIIGQIRAVKKDANLVVRSPLKCQHEKGMCQKCMGIGPDGKHYEVGTNVGVMAAHSLGEKTTQMMLNSFHTGGVATGRKDPFEQFKQLVNLPEKVPNEATLAMRSGTITKVEPHKLGSYVYVDGQPHFVGRDRGGKPLNEPLPVPGSSYTPWQPPKAGMRVKAGQILSDPNRTTVNPHHLHQATGKIDVVRNHLSNEIYGLYKDHGVDRKHVDVLVNSMTSTTKVVDPGGSDVLRGEYRNTNWVKNQNKLLRAQGKPTVQHAPILKGINEMPLHMREDWMAKLQHQKLKQTILEAAATGGSTSLHGPHPVPGMAYGAEFGMTSKDALRPGKSHLKDVEPYHY